MPGEVILLKNTLGKRLTRCRNDGTIVLLGQPCGKASPRCPRQVRPYLAGEQRYTHSKLPQTGATPWNGQLLQRGRQINR